MSTPLTRDEVLRIVREARKRGERADLGGADLGGADLGGAYLRGADLRGAYLRGADLRGAYLGGADLGGANLSRANLCGAYLCGADLRGAYLRGADLRGANLCGANLYGANLRGAYLRGASLSGAAGGLLAIDGLPSGSVRLAPTPDGWALRVGCWGDGTATYGPDALRDLIAGTDWPEARGKERDRRRPSLAALADLCDAHIAMWPNLVPRLAEKWGATA